MIKIEFRNKDEDQDNVEESQQNTHIVVHKVQNDVHQSNWESTMQILMWEIITDKSTQ